MNIAVFGATGPTGKTFCRQALDAGHSLTVAARNPAAFDLAHDRLRVVKADVMDEPSLLPVVAGADAVVSTIGTAYSRKPISLYSRGTAAIVAAMRAGAKGKRLVVVSAGLTELPPKGRGFFADYLVLPLLHSVIGRTLYADMLRMERLLEASLDIDWTIMRPAQLIDGDRVSHYALDPDFPRGNYTTRPDLAAAILAELDAAEHVHRKVGPSTR